MKYWADFEDSGYPRVRVWHEDSEGEPKSFAAAKQEIIDHFQTQIRDAREYIKYIRQQTVAYVKKEDEE